MYEEKIHRKYPVALKFDCRKMEKSAIAEFAERLERFLEVKIIGGVIVYATGKVTNETYGKVWDISDCYNVIID